MTTEMPASRGDFVTLVSGLPHAGASRVLRMLGAGGLSANIQNTRANEPLLKDDTSWIPEALGQVVRLPFKLIYELAGPPEYRLLFLQRDVGEIVRLQEAMLSRSGQDPDIAMRDVLVRTFEADMIAFRRWASNQPHMRMHVVSHSVLLEDPERVARDIAAFLGLPLDVQAMAAAAMPTQEVDD